MEVSGQRNSVVELHFRAAQVYDDPYNDVDLDIAFVGPDEMEVHIPAFWAGGNLWVARLAGKETGTYRFESQCSNEADSGLHGIGGALHVTEYTGENPLLTHGRLCIAPDRRHFEQADGAPFFWMADTWWMGLTQRLDWPRGFQVLTADRVDKGFNVIQIVAGPLPDMDAWDDRGRNEAGFPFEEGFAGVNPAYFDHADLKIGHLVHRGLMPCIVGMWGYYLPEIGVDRIKRFWRYLVARYGAYPVVWCIAGEGTMPYYLSEDREAEIEAQREGWSEVAAYVRQIDGYRNLITIHPTEYGREQVNDPNLLDFEMLQTGHGDIESIPNVARCVMTAVAREPVMPVVNAEVNYEGIMGWCWQNIQRLAFYTAAFSGAAGHTYGANGIWQACEDDPPYGPSPHGRCWGNTPWWEAMQHPGAAQVAHGAWLFSQFPWWAFERHPEWAEPQAEDETAPYGIRCVGIPGKVRLIYVPRLWDPPMIKGIEPDITYHASYYDPVTGEELDLGPVEDDQSGNWTPPFPPEVHDWIIILETEALAEERAWQERPD